MRINADKFDSSLKADGGGAFSRVEYLDNGVLLRVATVKELTGAAHFYFGSDRAQIMTGMGFSAVPFAGGAVGYRLRYGSFYKFITNIEFVKPIPEYVHAEIEVLSNMCGDMFVIPIKFKPGFKGRISFTASMTRRTEMVEMFAFSRLIFFSPNKENKITNKTKKGKKNETIISVKQKPAK